MTSYLFIEQLFKNVLAKSKVIQGRFHTCPRWGQEMNTDEFQAVIKDVVKAVNGKEYPVCLMMPPVSRMSLKDDTGEWERYTIELFFLTTTYTTGTNQIKQPNRKTQTSTHTIEMDWEDMKRCAKDFILGLGKIAENKTPQDYPFRLIDSEKKYFEPVTLIGNDRVSGVKVSFGADLWTGCEIEDYDNSTDWGAIEIPSLNIHPSHLH